MSKSKHNKDNRTSEDLNRTAGTQPETGAGENPTDSEAQASQEATNETTDEEKIEQLEAQLAEMKDKYLRQVAEFDNYRKRTLKEKTELILNGGEKVLTALLPVLDDLDRASENLQKSDDVEALRKGVELISQKLLGVLHNQGLKEIDTAGKDFNTDYHEAIAMVPAQSDDQKGKVVDCVQKGYMLNDKVIRHAKVAIGQ